MKDNITSTQLLEQETTRVTACTNFGRGQGTQTKDNNNMVTKGTQTSITTDFT